MAGRCSAILIGSCGSLSQSDWWAHDNRWCDLGDSTNPIHAGSHVLQVPDHPHAAGASYSQYGTVWFRIGNSGDRYLHPGSVSLGCATCQGSYWLQIYETIIKRRDGSGNVGSLIAT